MSKSKNFIFRVGDKETVVPAEKVVLMDLMVLPSAQFTHIKTASKIGCEVRFETEFSEFKVTMENEKEEAERAFDMLEKLRVSGERTKIEYE